MMFESVQAVKAVSEASNLFHAPPSLKLQRTDLHQYLQDRHEEYDDDVLGQRCCFSAAQKPSPLQRIAKPFEGLHQFSCS